VAAIGSFLGGTLSVIGLTLFAPLLADAMLQVGPAAEFVLMVLALLVVAFVSSGPLIKTLAMLLLGLAIAAVGLDQLTGWPRFTYGAIELADGIGFVPLAIGLFGVSEILLDLDRRDRVRPIRPRLRDLMPNPEDLRQAAPAMGRGSVIGFFFGVIPGVSHVISTFVSYAVEKRLSKTPEQFGHGAIAGVAGPESANNATTGSSMIPLLVLGIPAIPVTAILLSAMLIHGVRPGPQLVSDHPGVFWGLIASMYIGNGLLLLLNLPLVGVFVSLLRIPHAYLTPSILLISLVGVYSIGASEMDLWIMVASGIVGYLLRKFGFDVAPLLLALVLGDRIEVNFRRALSISGGDYAVFVQGAALKIALAALAIVLLLQLAAALAGYRKRAAERLADSKRE
jgi:putative tricarboxylic transport membrane protein